MTIARPLRGSDAKDGVMFALAERTPPGQRERALSRWLACELFDAWCSAHRSDGLTSAAVVESAVALGGRLGDDAAALRARVRNGLREGRVLALREGRGGVASVAPPERVEAHGTIVGQKLEDIRIVTVEDRTWRPVSGIKLTLAPSGGGPVTRGSDDEGAVELRGLRPGPCRVSAASDGATFETCYEIVGIGAGNPPPPADEEDADAEARDKRKFALVLGRHKVATGETLASVAEAHGMTWQQLAQFNFGSTAPRDVNRGLRGRVGCRRKTADRANYVFDTNDKPGILFIPRPWEDAGLRTDRTYTLTLRVPRLERQPFLFSM
nr:LysM peptidoglycan-binding domain-containing protein [Deltaproteobacteria bacterium]